MLGFVAAHETAADAAVYVTDMSWDRRPWEKNQMVFGKDGGMSVREAAPCSFSSRCNSLRLSRRWAGHFPRFPEDGVQRGKPGVLARLRGLQEDPLSSQAGLQGPADLRGVHRRAGSSRGGCAGTPGRQSVPPAQGAGPSFPSETCGVPGSQGAVPSLPEVMLRSG